MRSERSSRRSDDGGLRLLVLVLALAGWVVAVQFFLGCAIPAWLGRTSIPLFVSRARLAGLKKLPRALGPWALDSGAFTMLDQHGRWTVGPEQYADEVQHWSDVIGKLGWAAI